METTTLTVITDLINSVGFPIVVSGCLFWFIKNTLTKINETLTTFNISIVQNTATMEKLSNKIEGLK